MHSAFFYKVDKAERKVVKLLRRIGHYFLLEATSKMLTFVETNGED